MNWDYIPCAVHAALGWMNMSAVGHCHWRRDAAELRSRKGCIWNDRYFRCHHRHASSSSMIAINGRGSVGGRLIGKFPLWLRLGRSSILKSSLRGLRLGQVAAQSGCGLAFGLLGGSSGLRHSRATTLVAAPLPVTRTSKKGMRGSAVTV